MINNSAPELPSSQFADVKDGKNVTIFFLSLLRSLHSQYVLSWRRLQMHLDQCNGFLHLLQPLWHLPQSEFYRKRKGNNVSNVFLSLDRRQDKNAKAVYQLVYVNVTIEYVLKCIITRVFHCLAIFSLLYKEYLMHNKQN